MPAPERLRGALLCLLLLCCGLAHAAPRIGIVTMAPGQVFWERFGHDAIVVDDPVLGEPVSYNFGYFDLSEEGFVSRFIRGDMQYMLVALPLREDLGQYRDNGRGVTVQWLDLAPGQARALADALAHNARPENARYRYDYFRDNCATRVRDALDAALGGGLRRQLEVRSAGDTWRSESVRLARPASWMWLGFDVGLGPAADRPLSLWERGFIPMRLADALREAVNSEGRPLVLAEERILPHRIEPEPEERLRRLTPWLLAGLALGGLALALRTRPRALGAFAAALWLLAGIAGTLMLFVWLGTEHWAGWANRNLLLLSPLCLGLLPAAWRLLRGRTPARWQQRLAWLVAGLALLALPMLWLQALPQRNGQWIALLLPLHLALAWGLSRLPRMGTAAGIAR